MAFYRQYMDENKDSHVENLDPSILEKIKKWQTAKGFRLIVIEPGTVLDWHKAEAPNIVVALQGEIEFGYTDGSTRRYKAGDMRMVYDTEGLGHRYKVLSDIPYMALMVDISNSKEAEGEENG
jgi:quercetin dioxygenase-like cupin family protein